MRAGAAPYGSAFAISMETLPSFRLRESVCGTRIRLAEWHAKRTCLPLRWAQARVLKVPDTRTAHRFFPSTPLLRSRPRPGVSGSELAWNRAVVIRRVAGRQHVEDGGRCRWSSRSTASVSAPYAGAHAFGLRRSMPAVIWPSCTACHQCPAVRISSAVPNLAISRASMRAAVPAQGYRHDPAAAGQPASPGLPGCPHAGQRIGNGVAGKLEGAGSGVHQVGKPGRDPASSPKATQLPAGSSRP